MVIAAAGIGARFVFEPLLGNSGFVVFLIAIVIGAWVGGLGPSLLGQTVLLVATAVWFSPAQKQERTLFQALLGIGAFYGVGSSIALLSDARRKADEQQREQRREAISQREQLRATLSCMGDGVLVTDAQWRLTLMNPEAQRLTGWASDEAIGRPIQEVFNIVVEHQQDRPHNPSSLLAMQQCAHLALLNRHGARVPITFSAAPLSHQCGESDSHHNHSPANDDRDNELRDGYVLVVRDETERRRIEDALCEADRKKDRFLATLAHELRNPLAPICAGLELMKVQGQSPRELEEIRSIMERQTKHMVSLIDDLLDVSRITRGRVELRKNWTLLAQIVKDAVDATEPIFQEARHELIVRLPSQPIRLFVDPSRLTQVLSNLLSNAAKYTPAKGRVELSAELAQESITISVRDNGIGIPADKFAYVFEMFAQVNGDAERGHSGLGIGLMLVKQLVELHGGNVHVESDGPRRGSVFRVCLPLTLALSAPIEPAAPAVVPTADSKPQRILVVDDNQDVLETLAKMVEKLGHEVCRASDGYAAVEAVKTWSPEVVLMDLGMPRLNGYDAAKLIRELSNGKDLLLVAITGWGQDEDRRRTQAAGFDCHLVKPIDLNALRNTLSASAKINSVARELTGVG